MRNEDIRYQKLELTFPGGMNEGQPLAISTRLILLCAAPTKTTKIFAQLIIMVGYNILSNMRGQLYHSLLLLPC